MSLYALFTNKAYILVLIYTCFVIYQMYYVKYYIINWHSLVVGDKTLHMQHNIKNKAKLNKAFKKVISYKLKKLEEMSYECHHDVFGSDHRAVSAHLKIKNFGMQHYCDL